MSACEAVAVWIGNSAAGSDAFNEVGFLRRKTRGSASITCSFSLSVKKCASCQNDPRPIGSLPVGKLIRVDRVQDPTRASGNYIWQLQVDTKIVAVLRAFTGPAYSVIAGGESTNRDNDIGVQELKDIMYLHNSSGNTPSWVPFGIFSQNAIWNVQNDGQAPLPPDRYFSSNEFHWYGPSIQMVSDHHLGAGPDGSGHTP